VVVHQTRPEHTPGGPRPVEHKDAARRQDILRAATTLFAEQGYRETNLNQIAVELGFRRQAVYHYFPAKDEILYELIAQAGEAMISTSQPIFDADLQPDTALTEIVRNHVRVVLAQPDTFRVQFAELNKLSGPRAEILRKGMSEYIHRIADVIAAGQRAGLFVPAHPMTQALLLVGMCNGTTQWFESPRANGSTDAIADQAAHIALSGLTGTTTKPPKTTSRRTRT
jgi:AcrR family transcriptional regulator